MPTYTDDFLTKRASEGGKDSGRKKTLDKLSAAATQPPHGDDAAALSELQRLSGLGGQGAFATADARNYGKLLLSRIDPTYTPDYDRPNDGSFSIGKALGTVLRVGAPIAGLAIPGLGTLGAAALSGVGNTAGQLISRGRINPLESLAAGATPGLAKLAFGGGAGGAVGNATQAGVGAASQGSGFLGGALSKLGGLGGIAKIGLGTAGFLGDRAQRKSAERFANAQLGLRQRQLDLAEEDFSTRAPLRSAAFSRLGSIARGPIGSSVYR